MPGGELSVDRLLAAGQSVVAPTQAAHLDTSDDCAAGEQESASVEGPVRRSAAKDGHWDAWTCDHERLLKLANILDACVIALRDGSALPRRDLNELRDEHFHVELEARHRDLLMKERGAPAAVLRTLDAVRLESMVLTVGVRPARVVAMPHELVELDLPPTLANSRSEDAAFFAAISLSKSRGIGLHVRGCDPRWVLSTYTELANEITKALPWWRFLRSGKLWWAYAPFCAAVASYGLAPSLRGHHGWWLLASVVTGSVLGGLVLATARRVLPGFEILSHGRNGKGARVLAVAGALASNVALGVLVNKATK